MELIKSTPAAGSEQQPQQPQSNVYDEIRQEIDKMDPYAETITLTYHLRQFAELFLRRINDDQTLNTLFAHLNEAALADNKFAVKMATVFGSHQLGDAMIQETKIRNAMIGTLQQNFLAIERLKQSDPQRFYNSVTLLGEYYNRKKVLNGRRINILGQSLLLLLTSELEQEITKSAATQQQPPHQMDAEFAKLLLEQITLNGAVAKEDHRKEITDLLFTIRKALITVPNLCSRTKAFLLMALDLYHSNLPEDLFAKLYSKYLSEPQQPAVPTTTSTQSIESVREVPPSGESKQPTANGECTVRGQQEKSSPEAVVTPKATGIRANSNSRGTPAGVGKPPSPQNGARTIHDKENTRRSSSRTKAAPEKKTPPASQASKRNVRVSEDGKIVATITRDSPASPTKKAPPSPTVGTIRTERSPVKKGLSPRLERLAALPKITITCSTPSPKRQAGNTSATSPRAVLGVASAKQQQQLSPKQPPKSPIRPPTPKSVPEMQKSPGGNGQSRATLSSPAQGTNSVETNKSTKAPHDAGTLPPKECGVGGTEKHHENGKTTPKSSPSTEVSKELTNQMSNGRERINKSDSSSLHASNDAGNPPVLDNGVTGSVSNGTSDGTVKAENTQEAPEGALKPTVKSYFREDNMENLSWDAMNALDDDSPQKLNPHTKSFLSFLADH
ncbi:mucin-2 [Anopheles coustani]|nr:mucin-2 [Anopheles coustani]